MDLRRLVVEGLVDLTGPAGKLARVAGQQPVGSLCVDVLCRERPTPLWKRGLLTSSICPG